MGGWTPEQDLEFSMQQALKNSKITLDDMQRRLDDEKWRAFARKVIEQLRFQNWKIERGPTRGGHSSKTITSGEQSTFKSFDDKTS